MTVDESLVKEEILDHDSGQDNLMDSGMDYGSLGSDSRLDGSGVGGEDDGSSQMLPNKYEPKMTPTSQAHQLPEAVVEALAGPSGMQGVRNVILPKLRTKHLYCGFFVFLAV